MSEEKRGFKGRGRTGGDRAGFKKGGFGKKRFGSGPERGWDRERNRDRPRREEGQAPEDRPWREERNRRDQRAPQHRQDSPYRGMYSGPKRPATEGEAARERPHLAENEIHYHGHNACLALWKQRPQDIIRVYVLREKAEQYTELLEFCAKNRKSYHLVGERDLERLSDSVHHQGICIVAKMKRFGREESLFREIGSGRALVLYLDGVANPHNLGAILRSAAHFGVNYVCLPKEEITKISPALYRTAEGAAEFVNLVRVEDTEKFLDRLSGMGFQLYAFEASGAQSLFDTRVHERSVFVFGNEVEGLSGLIRTIVEAKVSIPGTGHVESLNVSVAAALAMAEFSKQASAKTVRIVKTKA